MPCDVNAKTAPLWRERMNAALAADIAAKRAETLARMANLSPSQKAAAEQYWQRRTERSLRSKEASRDGRRSKRPRDDNPAPAPTRQWAKPVSLEAASDTRLTMGARCALLVVRALTARSKRVSKAGLATVLGVHIRTAQRYLAELRKRGYIRTRLMTNRIGSIIGQMIEITEKTLPAHHRPRLAADMADGLARCLQTAESRRNAGETGLSPSKLEELILTGERDRSGAMPLLACAS